MDEAEALSKKIAIMTEGRFRVFGGLAQLKHKYGKGFEIELKLKPESVEQMNQRIKAHGFQQGLMIN